MGTWLDFLQVTLALGLGWLGWVLFTMTRAAGRTVSQVSSQAQRAPARGVQLLSPRRRL